VRREGNTKSRVVPFSLRGSQLTMTPFFGPWQIVRRSPSCGEVESPDWKSYCSHEE